MNKLRVSLKQDLAGEHKAIKDYGTRIKQTAGTKIAGTLKEIQGDEKDHKSKLRNILMTRGMKMGGF